MKLLNKYKDIVRVTMNVVFALCFVIGYDFYFFSGNVFGKQSVFNFVLLFLAIYLLNSNNRVSFKDKKITFIFAFVLSLSLLVGQKVYLYNDVGMLFNSLKAVIIFLISITGFSAIFGEILFVIFRKIKTIEFHSKKIWKFYSNKYSFVILWAVIFLCWIPAFLAYYPGILSYDSNAQLLQIFDVVDYSKAHPPIHTFILQLCFIVCGKTGNMALVLYSLLQMLFLSAVFAKMISYIISKKVNNWFILLSILFVSINPVIAVFSMIMTKDIYFSGFFILFVIEVLKIIEEPNLYLKSLKKWLWFVFVVFMMCLFRNNAIYVYLIFTPILVFIFKQYWKRLLPLMITPVLLFYLINNVFYGCLGIKDSSSVEKLSVPLQQISYVVIKNDSSLTDSEKNAIDKYINYEAIKDNYNYRLADPIKVKSDKNYYIKNKLGFYKLWVKLGLKYPLDYLSAFLTLNLPYWYIDADTNDEYSKRVYIETNMLSIDEYNLQRDSKLPLLLTNYEKTSSYEAFESLPFISNLFSITLPFWMIVFSGFVLLYRKKYKYILVLLPMILLWLTYMVGPVSNFRYVFPLFALYPLMFLIMFNFEKV